MARPGLAVALLVVMAAALRLPHLGESLWYDEVVYSTRYAASSLDSLWRFFLTDPSAPLYRVLLFFWVEVFGDSELSVRAPSLLFGIASIGLTYGIARRFGSWWVAFLAASFLCFAPAHVWYSQEATPYAMTLFFLLATVLAWLRVRADPTRPAWYAVYCVALLAAVFTHYFAALCLLPLTLMSLRLERSPRRRILAAHAVIVLALAVAMGLKHQLGQIATGQAFLRPFTPFEWWMLFFNWFLQGNSLWTVSPYRANVSYLLGEPLFLATQAFFCLLFLRGLFSYRAQPRGIWELLVLTCAVPLVMLLLTQRGYGQLYIERYLLVLLPFVAIVLARGAASFANVKAVIACSAAMGVIGAASYGAWLQKSETWTVYKQNPDWRAAARYLGVQVVEPREAVVVATIFPAELAYYFPRERKVPAPRIVTYGVESLLEDDHVKALYLIKNNFWKAGVDEVLQRLKGESRLELTATESFKGLEIYTFVPRGAPGA
jgi:uncharacterized membrane protein